MDKNIRDVVEKNLSLMQSKSDDYSKDNIWATGINGVASRLMDKITRLLNLSSKEEIKFESLEDTLMDIFNYALIGQLLMSDEWEKTTRFVFLGGAIDMVEKGDAREWRKDIAERLIPHSITCYNPYTAFAVSRKHMASDRVRAVNRAAILQSDVLLVKIVSGQPAFGTIREIEFAKTNGIRVIVWANYALELHMEAYDIEVVHSMEEAIRILTHGKN